MKKDSTYLKMKKGKSFLFESLQQQPEEFTVLLRLLVGIMVILIILKMGSYQKPVPPQCQKIIEKHGIHSMNFEAYQRCKINPSLFGSQDK